MDTAVTDNQAAIGIFDSGIGGLSVALAVRQLMPNENLLYVADTAHAPYGDKTDDYIYQRMDNITQHLIGCGVKAIVVACNTATTAAISKLRAQYPLPIIGVEPGVKPAVLVSKRKVVGVLATPRTLLTPAFATLTQRFAAQAKVLLQPCPQLVPQIEALALASPQMRELVKSYIQPLLAQGADTLVLGCTHYNFIADVVAGIAGADITIVRTENAVARQVQLRLTSEGKLSQAITPANALFFSSGDANLFQRQVTFFWSCWPRPSLMRLEI